jgi:tetratricopeptide (TPR) repeat protein
LDAETAQSYAAGRLDAAVTSAVEEHLLICRRCQAEVGLAVGLREVSRTAATPPVFSRGRLMAVLSLALAAGVVLVLLVPRGPDAKLAALGRVVEPPAYLGLGVRGVARAGDSAFAAAMDAYVARRYDGAASGLKAALAAGVDSITAEFFLASAELMRGRPREAADGYARVIAAGSFAAPYLPEAHAFRARALLQLGRPSEALAELEHVTGLGGLDGAAASALADSVREVQRR